MNLAVIMMLGMSAPGQVFYGPPVYCPPQTYYCPPVVVAPQLHNVIHFDGRQTSKRYVRARYGNKTFEIPIINNIIPRYNETKYSDGRITRHFYYDTGVYYKGKMPVYANDARTRPRTTPAPARTVPSPSIQKPPARTTPPKLVPVPKPIERRESPGLDELRRDNQRLKDRIKDLDNEVDKLKKPTTFRGLSVPPDQVKNKLASKTALGNVPPLPLTEGKGLYNVEAAPPNKTTIPVPNLADFRRLESSITDIRGELETIRTLHKGQNEATITTLENALEEIKTELKKLQDRQKPADSPGAEFVIPPIIDPESGILRNRPLKMIRPSEIK